MDIPWNIHKYNLRESAVIYQKLNLTDSVAKIDKKAFKPTVSHNEMHVFVNITK